MQNKVSKVINVYQEKYTNDEYCTGLGDFIRGTLCLLQYANIQSLDCDMHYANHPIADFLHHRKEEDIIINPFRVFCYKSNHLDNNTLRKIKNDFAGVIDKNPHTPAFQKSIDATMARMQIQPKEYNLIHVRTGDEYLMHGAYTSTQITIDCKRAFRKVFPNHELTKKNNDKRGEEKRDDNHQENQPTKYVIISDNVTLKQNIKRAFPSLIVECNPISHLGENACGKTEEVVNTLVDFFLIANAKKVFGFSSLTHGTGFSQQCCQIYDVPYECCSL